MKTKYFRILWHVFSGIRKKGTQNCITTRDFKISAFELIENDRRFRRTKEKITEGGEEEIIN